MPALVLAACGKPAKPPVAAAAPPPAPAVAVDDAWALAPPAPMAAAVIDSGALTAIDHDLQTALPILSVFAKGKDISYQRLVQRLTGAPQATSLGDAGLDPARGLIGFVVRGGWVAVLPVADRDRFIAAHGGHVDASRGVDVFDHMTCTMRRGRYACASRADLLDHLGAGAARIRGRWPADLRGDVEVWVDRDALRTIFRQQWLDPTGDAVLAIAAPRGELTLRLRAPGRWNPMLAALVARPARLDARGARGFVAMDIGALLPLVAAAAPPKPIAAGVTLRDVAGAFDGALQVIVPAGVSDVEGRVGLTNAAPIQTLIDHCPDLVPPLGQITATTSGGTCRLSVSQAGKTFAVDVWTEAGELRFAGHRHAFGAATAEVPLGPAGAELADGTWTATAWGRGSLYRNFGPPQKVPTIVPGIKEVLGAMFSISEVGLGVRIGSDGLSVLAHVRLSTADPPEVQAALDDLLDAILDGQLVDARADAVAARFPQSAFADDHRAGFAGLMVPIAAVGMAAGIVSPLLQHRLNAPATVPPPQPKPSLLPAP